MDNPWSERENQLIIADYFEMLLREAAGEDYVKARYRRNLKPKLDNRSDGSIEYKHQNISAVLAVLGLPYVEGYKPAMNYQHRLRSAVESFLQNNPKLISRLVQYAADTLPLATKSSHLLEVEAPAFEETNRIWKAREPQQVYTPVDYVLQEANNQALGKLGEQAVLAFEKNRLQQSGRPDLAGEVEWTAKDVGEGRGYDIRSFELSEKERFIEVKTTKHGIYFPFYLTANELRFSEAHKDSFYLYRVFSFRTRPKLYVKSGSISSVFQLQPYVYKAWP